MIILENVTKSYPGPNGPVFALKDINLSVERGEFVAVMGPSGCGKSTLLSIVGGLSRPSSGRVVVNGLALHTASPGTLAEFRQRHVGFVFQMFHLLPYLNVLQNVLAAASPDHQRAAQQRARELLVRFGLGDRLDHRPAELSAGERQRVAIARALINQPALLLADEPTGNLDPASASDVLEIIAGFHREGGTVLLVTHASYAAAYAQRVFRLRQGEVEHTAETKNPPPAMPAVS